MSDTPTAPKTPTTPPPSSKPDANDVPASARDEAQTPVPASAKSETKPEAINMDIFSQILELDDEGSCEFSQEMVSAYFSQATTTFGKMDKALEDKKLPELSSLGHFLKGSSAALGISRVQAACEKMQHFGDLRDVDGTTAIESEEAIVRIEVLLPEAKSEYKEAERWLKGYYADKDAPFPDSPTAPGTDSDAAPESAEP
ncbi:Histidine-phosphotransfer domain HPT-domain-containing protein [Mycena kentingensis (nom. inval.)]|nr:Histidine-phosphotransfer domain HPT-domain-containing protein [Mycena kentingensis (nom. inval.)]